VKAAVDEWEGKGNKLEKMVLSVFIILPIIIVEGGNAMGIMQIHADTN
jgi:hypothetical protein